MIQGVFNVCTSAVIKIFTAYIIEVSLNMLFCKHDPRLNKKIIKKKKKIKP